MGGFYHSFCSPPGSRKGKAHEEPQPTVAHMKTSTKNYPPVVRVIEIGVQTGGSPRSLPAATAAEREERERV